MAEQKPNCVMCGQTSDDLPLLMLEYRGQHYWICSEHLPVLIHQPQTLIGRLPGADKLKPHTD